MRIKEVMKILNGELICGEDYVERDVKVACGCDLMSDVLSFVKSDDTLLLSGLTSPQVIYTTDAVDIKAICFVRGKSPDKDIVDLANERGIVLFYTKLPLFESCGKLYEKGLKGCSEYE